MTPRAVARHAAHPAARMRLQLTRYLLEEPTVVSGSLTCQMTRWHAHGNAHRYPRRRQIRLKRTPKSASYPDDPSNNSCVATSPRRYDPWSLAGRRHKGRGEYEENDARETEFLPSGCIFRQLRKRGYVPCENTCVFYPRVRIRPATWNTKYSFYQCKYRELSSGAIAVHRLVPAITPIPLFLILH